VDAGKVKLRFQAVTCGATHNVSLEVRHEQDITTKMKALLHVLGVVKVYRRGGIISDDLNEASDRLECEKALLEKEAVAADLTDDGCRIT
jgi:hypothetical protein